MSRVLRAWVLLLPLLLAAGSGDSRGWSVGQPAARTAEVLKGVDSELVQLPDFIMERVTRTTFIYYFSPSCGHCQATIPEVVRLHAQIGDEVDFLGVASSQATRSAIGEFKDSFGVPFDLISDSDRGFADAVAARSTPTVIVVEPSKNGPRVRDAYFPWRQGNSLMVRMALRPQEAMAQFEPGVYQGPNACGSCHEQEVLSWALSHHAVAYRTLYNRERAEDTECVGCHVTGMDEPTGFELADHGSPLAGVGCEACHSAGGPHDGEPVNARDTCVECHDAEHSIAFSVEKGMPHIDHYMANTMTEAEQAERWKKLINGEAERPLLAFPEGINQGAQACESCHPEAVKAWSASAHGSAHDSLSSAERADPECLRCHSTPPADRLSKEGGGTPVDDAVGCESCHGPGEQHVADPKVSNILGLGESCPECVIEEVCTSCHTPKWDPEWSLKPRMKAIKGHGAG